MRSTSPDVRSGVSARSPSARAQSPNASRRRSPMRMRSGMEVSDVIVEADDVFGRASIRGRLRAGGPGESGIPCA